MDGTSTSAFGQLEDDKEVVTVLLQDMLGLDQHIDSTISAMFGVGPLGRDVNLTDDEDEATTSQVLSGTGQPMKPTLTAMFGIGHSGRDVTEFRGLLPGGLPCPDQVPGTVPLKTTASPVSHPHG